MLGFSPDFLPCPPPDFPPLSRKNHFWIFLKFVPLFSPDTTNRKFRPLPRTSKPFPKTQNRKFRPGCMLFRWPSPRIFTGFPSISPPDLVTLTPKDFQTKARQMYLKFAPGCMLFRWPLSPDTKIENSDPFPGHKNRKFRPFPRTLSNS